MDQRLSLVMAIPGPRNKRMTYLDSVRNVKLSGSTHHLTNNVITMMTFQVMEKLERNAQNAKTKKPKQKYTGQHQKEIKSRQQKVWRRYN